MEESDSDSDTGYANEKSDNEGSYYDEEEFDDGDLPEFFCGTLIQRIPRPRSISNPTCPPPNLPNNESSSATYPPPNLRNNTSASASSSSKEIENDCQTRAQSHQSNPDSNSNQDNNEDDNNRPPSPWGSSNSKQQIINELKDSTSDIHLLIGNYTLTNFEKVNFKRIHHQYANKYKYSLFRENLKRILKQFLNKTGSFKVEDVVVEPWYTSVNNVSTAYALLYLLYMDPEKSYQVEQMTHEQIWQSSPLFQKYELEKFKSYNSNMKKLTDKRRQLIRIEMAAYREDMLTLPPATITSRGYPFWNKHRASELLKEDEANGVAKEMQPKQLWKSRVEYQDFPLPVFRKHIYQERMKQLAAPYWQYKRNENATKRFEKAQKELKEWHQNQFDKSMDEVIEEWGRVNLRDE